MGSGCCGSEEKATYECAANPKGCPPKQVPANTPAPSCCGKPMKKQVAASSCR